MMLGSVLGGGHLKDISYTKESFLSISVSYNLEDCEVFQDTVHHVLLGEMFEFENKVDHVFTHRGAVEFVNKPSSFEPGVLRLNFFHHLFAKAANFCRALNRHILGALVSGGDAIKSTRILRGVSIEVGPKFY